MARPLNQSTSQRTDHRANRWQIRRIAQRIAKCGYESVDGPPNQSRRQSANRSVSRSVRQSQDHATNRPTNQRMRICIEKSENRSIRQSTAWRQSMRQSTNQATTQTMRQSSNVPSNEWPTNGQSTNAHPSKESMRESTSGWSAQSTNRRTIRRTNKPNAESQRVSARTNEYIAESRNEPTERINE